MWPVYYSVSLIHTSERAVMFIQITMWLEYTTTDRKSSNQQIHEIVIERQQHFSIDNSISHRSQCLPVVVFPLLTLAFKIMTIHPDTNKREYVIFVEGWLVWNFIKLLEYTRTTRYDMWQSMWKRRSDHNDKQNRWKSGRQEDKEGEQRTD